MARNNGIREMLRLATERSAEADRDWSKTPGSPSSREVVKASTASTARVEEPLDIAKFVGLLTKAMGDTGTASDFLMSGITGMNPNKVIRDKHSKWPQPPLPDAKADVPSDTPDMGTW